LLSGVAVCALLVGSYVAVSPSPAHGLAALLGRTSADADTLTVDALPEQRSQSEELLATSRLADNPRGADAAARSLPVTFVRIGRTESASVVRATGVLIPERQAELGFERGGRVVHLSADIGDRVVAGQELARIEDPASDTRYRAALATVRERAQQFSRAQQMLESGITSRAQAERAEAAYAQAYASFSHSREERSHQRLVAPFAGTIARRSIDAGELVDRGTTAFVLVDDASSLVARVGVSAAEVARLAPGTRASIHTDTLPGRSFAARVDRMSVAASRESGVFEVELSVENSQGLLRPGLVIQADITTRGASDALVLPARALLNLEGHTASVFVIESGRARPVPVTVGAIRGDFLEIASGLAAGDQVVVAGADYLTAGALVDARPAEEATRVVASQIPREADPSHDTR